jgi:hypothetical protein
LAYSFSFSFALSYAVPARADLGDAAEFEYLLGATDINAAIGNGGATAAFSSQGELTVLRWPSPSYYQHVDFVTALGRDARTQPHFGARDNQGSFAGVYVEPGGFAWARDAGWTAKQQYAADDSNQVLTTLHNAALRVTVTYTDAVPDGLDVLVRRVAVTPDPGFTPTALRLVYFENFSPTVEKTDFLPNDQTSLIGQRDYALGMSGALGALVHFSITDRPDARVAALGAAKSRSDVDAFLGGLGDADAGMYLILAGDRMPDGYHCGYDADMPPAGAPVDAYRSAADTKGALGGSPAALAHADGALSWNLPTAGGAVDVFIAMGATYAAAASALAQAKSRGGDRIRADDRAFWTAWLSTAELPTTDDPDRLRLAQRALLALAVGRDRKTGSIVASVSSQPPYNLDWPRDSSFIDYALDVAGYHDWVGQHRHFFTTAQRKHNDEQAFEGGDTFAGSFANDYYADGAPGGPIPLEIDEVGLTLWSWYEHAKWIDEPARHMYLDDVYPSLKLAADLLTRCVDAPTRLQCKENEDDSFEPSVTLHGAMPVRLGLASAVRAAKYLGNLDDARRWKHRLDELDAAIERNFGDPALGYVGGDTTLGDVGAIGPVAWTIWPAEFHPYSDPRIALTAKQVADDFAPFFEMKDRSGSYFGKGLASLVRYYDAVGDAEGAARVRRWIDYLVKVVPTNTGHYGESFAYNGDGTYTNVVSIPHLWEGTLTYLSLMAAYGGDKFTRPELTTLDVPADGCAMGGRPSLSFPALAFILVFVSRERKRKR